MPIRVNSRIPVWEYILICLSTIYFIAPGVHASLPFYYFLFLELCYSVYIIWNRYVRVETFLKMLFLIVLVALLYTLLTDASSIGQYVSNRGLKRFLSKFMQYSCMFFPLMLFMRCVRSATSRQKLWLLILSITTFVLSCIPVLKLIAIDPLAARDFAQDQGEDFIAPYPFVYGMTFIFVASFILLTKIRRKYTRIRILSLILFSFSFYFLLKSQFTLSLLTSIITILIIVFLSISSPGSRLVYVVCIILLVIILPYLLEYLIIPYMPEMLADRLQEVTAFYNGTLSSNTDSDLYGRFDLYGRTIQAFFQSPIIGNKYLDFDGHATYLTVWADLGVFGGISVFALIITAKNKIKSILGDAAVFFVPVFIHLLLNGFTNPIHASTQIYISLWFIIPLALDYFKDKLELK